MSFYNPSNFSVPEPWCLTDASMQPNLLGYDYFPQSSATMALTPFEENSAICSMFSSSENSQAPLDYNMYTTLFGADAMFSDPIPYHTGNVDEGTAPLVPNMFDWNTQVMPSSFPSPYPSSDMFAIDTSMNEKYEWLSLANASGDLSPPETASPSSASSLSCALSVHGEECEDSQSLWCDTPLSATFESMKEDDRRTASEEDEEDEKDDNNDSDPDWAIGQKRHVSAARAPTRYAKRPCVATLSASSDSVTTHCANCETTNTPLWRRSVTGQTLCNACGLFLKLHKVMRPLSLKTDVIKKRNRASSTKNAKVTKKRSKASPRNRR